MDRVFKSKVGWWYHLVLLVMVASTVFAFSSYALSLDRLIIYKGDTQWLLISPVNKQDFVKLLKKHNPDIRIKEPVI